MTQFDLEAFKAFVASKPAEEAYNAFSLRTCALAQFGFPNLASGCCEKAGVPKSVYFAAVPDGRAKTTFGALAERLASLPDQSQ